VVEQIVFPFVNQRKYQESCQIR